MISTVCPTCGAESAPHARFCSVCGQALEQALEQPPPAAEDHLLQRLRSATLGDYDVVAELGRGGMAAVYLAWDLELARYVAIKVMYPELATRDSMPQRFLQEARTAANLDDHPNVVRVYRAKESHGLRFFVMRYIDGCSLEQLLHAVGALPVDVACYVVEQVARALHHAHGRGVVHRDVKPANVMLDRQGGVTVTDFGIAKVAQGEQLTRTGFAIGTPGYMSPEQWRVETLTSASDQYALGTVAYELLAGAPPFAGSLFEVQQRALLAPPPPLRERRPDVPADLEATVLRMLAKEPEARWPSLGAVVAALRLERRGGADALRASLAALVPRVLGTEPPGPHTPRSPVPAGRTARMTAPQPPEPIPVPTPVPVPEPPPELLPEPTPEPVPDWRAATGRRRAPLLVAGALALAATAAALALRDRPSDAEPDAGAVATIAAPPPAAPPVASPVVPQAIVPPVASASVAAASVATLPPATGSRRPVARVRDTAGVVAPLVRAPAPVVGITPAASQPAPPAAPPADAPAPAPAPADSYAATSATSATSAADAAAAPGAADARDAVTAFARALERRDASQVGRLLGGAQTAAMPRARLLQWLNATRQVAATVAWVGDVSRIDGRWTVPFRVDVRWVDAFGTLGAEQGRFRALLGRDGRWRLVGVAPATAFPSR